jgi:glycosyltransferase involved in cell wall biosynthesis
MKILQVVHNFLPKSYAGTEIYTFNFSKELCKKHSVFIFHRSRQQNRKDYELWQHKLDGLNIFSINNTCRSYANFEETYDNKSIEQVFIRVLDQIKPDIVHIQHLLFLSASIIRHIKQRGIPIVFTLHDYWLICPQGQFLKNNLTICNEPKERDCVECMISQLSLKNRALDIYYKLRNRLPFLLLKLLKKSFILYAKNTFLSEKKAINKIRKRKDYMKQVFADVDLFIAPSRFLLDKFLEYGVPSDKIIYIRNGINTNQFRDFERKKSDKLRFGFIGTIHPSKGLHTAIAAFNRIRDSNAELNIYGQILKHSGSEDYPQLLKKSCKNKNIYFMGKFDNSQIAKIFSEIDILLFLSIWYENSPLTIQEAFSSKTPIIASRIGGIAELIRDKEDGLLFEPSNPDDLYEKMKMFLDDAKLVDKFKNRINPSKSIEENTQELEELYKKTLGQDYIEKNYPFI